MIVVKVEIWPDGDEGRATEISRIGVVNADGSLNVAEYEVTALLARDTKEQVVKTEVRDHDRATGWLPLVRRVFTNLILRDSVCDDGSYDDPAAVHLRRGDRVGHTGSDHR